MSQDTIRDMNSSEPTTEGDSIADYMGMNPFIIYEAHGYLKVAIVEGISHKDAGPIKVRTQGVRKGERGYNAKGTISTRPLVPVLTFIEEALVDKMLVSPTALAMGEAALSAMNPRTNPLVDVLVEEYEESASLEREFFLPEESDSEGLLDLPVVTANVISAVELGSPSDEEVYPYTGPETMAGDVMTAPFQAEPIDPLHHTTEIEDAPTLEPGLVEGGELVGFDPKVHIVP